MEKIIEKFIDTPPNPYTYVNVNIPQGSIDEIRAFACAVSAWGMDQGDRIPYGPVRTSLLLDGREYENLEPDDPECDHNLLANNYVTIVPQIDNTNYPELERLKDVWKDLTRERKTKGICDTSSSPEKYP